MKIAVFVGSLQRKSFNKMLAATLEELKPENMEFNYIDIDVPLFNQDLEADYPAKAQAIKDVVEAADGVLFVIPEYNRSVPGVLKNAIDWASQPVGKNSFAGKPAAMLGASVGPLGTAVAQSELRQILVYLEAKLMGQPEVYVANAGEVFNEAGELTSQRWRKNFQAFITTFASWVEREK